jgi:hypothetical protein
MKFLIKPMKQFNMKRLKKQEVGEGEGGGKGQFTQGGTHELTTIYLMLGHLNS